MTTDDDIARRARSLPRSIEPDRDLWPGIAARLDETTAPPPREAHRRSAWRLPLALAAGVLLATFVGFWTGRVLEQPAEPALGGTAVTNPAGVLPTGLVPGAELQQTRAALVADIERRLASLPPSTRNVVADNLLIINQALDEIDAALESSPRSGLDTRLLMSMYADQLVLMNAMNNTLHTAHPEITL